MENIRNLKNIVYNCLKCENFKENQCNLNKNIDLIQNCKDFIPASNISKEKMIEMWKNLQHRLNNELRTNREIQLLLIRERVYNEKNLPLNISKEEIIELWKKTNNDLIQILEKNKKLHQLLSNLNIVRNEREKRREKRREKLEFYKLLIEEEKIKKIITVMDYGYYGNGSKHCNLYNPSPVSISAIVGALLQIL